MTIGEIPQDRKMDMVPLLVPLIPINLLKENPLEAKRLLVEHYRSIAAANRHILTRNQTPLGLIEEYEGKVDDFAEIIGQIGFGSDQTNLRKNVLSSQRMKSVTYSERAVQSVGQVSKRPVQAAFPKFADALWRQRHLDDATDEELPIRVDEIGGIPKIQNEQVMRVVRQDI